MIKTGTGNLQKGELLDYNSKINSIFLTRIIKNRNPFREKRVRRLPEKAEVEKVILKYCI